MRPGNYYMHKNCLDVCIKVLKSFQVTGNRYKVRVEWVNLGYSGTPWLLGEVQTLDIKTPTDWKNISTLINIKRARSGLPL